MSTERSTRLQTAYKVLETYSTLNVEKMLEPLADNFTHQVLPESLGQPPRDRETFAKHATGFTSIFKEFAMVPQTVFEDPENNAVVAYCKMEGELNGLGPWHNECIIIMKMSEDGTKLVEHKEFVDSAKAKLLREKLMGKMDKEMNVGKQG